MESAMFFKILNFLLLFFIAGPLLAEFSFYCWHRWIAHIGILRWLPRDFLRSRHYHHHWDQYPRHQLRTAEYNTACDITFHILYVVMIVLLIVGLTTGLISFGGLAPLFLGATAFGLLQSFIHDTFHIKYIELKKNWRWIFQFQWFRKYYIWLRKCHDVHHITNANYFILIPVDWFFGTLVTKAPPQMDDMFPGFDPKLDSTCGQPLFRR